MLDKDLKKLLKQIKPQGFTVDQGSRKTTLIAPNGARTNLPTGNNNRMGITFVKKFVKANGGTL